MAEVRIPAYAPSGPTLAAFLESEARGRLIQGPIGGAKTTACLQDGLRKGIRHLPRSPVDGWKRAKFTIIRKTYRDLERTTIPSWFKWFPREIGRWTGGKGGDPASHEIRFDGPLKLHLMVEFLAIGDRSAEEVGRGLETTFAFFNEIDLMSPDILDHIPGRLGRYPSGEHVPESHKNPDTGAATFWRGWWGDFNAPDVDSWLYDLIHDLPASIAYFRQPGGRDPAAENLQNLPENYYEENAEGRSADYVRRMIDNKFGYSRHGKAVYSEFSDQFHVASEPLRPEPGLPLWLGSDAGRTPAIIIGQRRPSGQWRILDEFLGDGVGAETFGREFRQYLAQHYPQDRFPISSHGADPAATYAGDASERSWLQIFCAHAKIPGRAAPGGNDLTGRIEAVRQPLARNIDGAPAFLLSPACKVLRRGFNADYRYRRMNIVTSSGEKRYDEKPEKNAASHPHDALQNGMLTAGAYNETRGADYRGRTDMTQHYAEAE